jgi:alkylation response protein AidB-like acyl-CoA dehydrogenase
MLNQSLDGSLAVGVGRELLDELVSGAARLAVRTEQERRIGPELADAIRRAGFARHFVPRRHGGAADGFAVLLAATAEVSAADPSVGWCASVFAGFGRMAAFLPEEAQEAVWSASPDTLIAGGLMPSGTAVSASGGWDLSGTWKFVSGVHEAEFLLLCSPVPQPDGTQEVRFLLVPRAACRIEESWFTMGMRGTGSESVVLDEPVYVPAAHTFARDELVRGRATADDSVLRPPLRTVTALTFAAPILGAARGILAASAAAAAAKQRAAAESKHRMTGDDSASMALDLARSAAEIDAAELLLARAAEDADRGRVLEPALGARASRDHVFAVDLGLGAIDRLMRRAGTSGRQNSSAIQRLWRDAQTAAGHAALGWEGAARSFTSTLLREV